MVLLGGTLYGTMSSFVKLSHSHGFRAAEISFWQAFIAAALLGLCACTVGKRSGRSLSGKDLLQLLPTGCAIGLTNYLYYESVASIPASLAIVILMQFTWFSLLMEWLLFRRKPSGAEWLTVFLILLGTLMAGKVFETEEWNVSPKGVLLALGASFTYAVYIIANGRCAGDLCWQKKSMAIMLGSSLCIFSINGARLLSGHYLCGDFFLWAFFLAVAGTTLPTALFAAGISRIGAGFSSILMTVELPVAILCARVILGERVSLLQMLGITLMLLSIIAMNCHKLSVAEHKTP